MHPNDIMNERNHNHPPLEKLFPTLQSKLRKLLLRSESANITAHDPVVKATYLGNVVTTWAKGDGSLERPASALWKNHVQGRGSIRMTVIVSPAGLRAETREHGITEYWNNRLTWCGVPKDYPKLFCWIYRHEGRKLKQELRCHAVLCGKEEAKILSNSLRYRLAEALFDFRKEKIQRQNARLSSLEWTYNYPSSESLNNYKRERTSPSKLSVIEELEEEALLPELRGYDKVLELLDMDLSGYVNEGDEMHGHNAGHSLSSSQSSQSSLCNDDEIHSNSQQQSHPVLYQQLCYNI